MKIIFLDIDGVLNSTRSFIAIGSSSPGFASRGHSPNFDPVAVGLLRRLVGRTGAQIVLSSTWRMGCPPEALKKAFADFYGWHDAPIIDSTPLLHKNRGTEIGMWIEQNGPCEYVILDDDADMLPGQMKRLVRTAFDTALGVDHIRKAASIFGIDDKALIVS